MILQEFPYRPFALSWTPHRSITGTIARTVSIARSSNPYKLGHPMPRYNPAVGEQCDTVKPRLLGINSCWWTRCLVTGIDAEGHHLTYYSGETVIAKDGWFAPLGTRSIDFDWRMGIKQGELIDAQDAQGVWYESTVLSVR